MVSDFLGTSIVKKNIYRFSSNKSLLVYCVDVKELIEKLGTAYNPLDWQLFIDSSKVSLKVVLLHNGNLFASMPLAQGFLNYGSRPHLGSFGEILGSRDFNGLMDGVAVLQDFYQKI